MLYILRTSFNFGIDVLDSDSFTDFSDDAMAHQTIALRLLLYKDLRFAELAEKVVQN